jgi:large subunit ribosomal protein L9
MEVILVKEVEKLGKIGDVVTVKDGFARNFLIPRGLAKPKTAGTLQLAEQAKRRQKAQLEKELEEAKILASRIASFSCTLRVKVGEGEKLFGAITAQDIADAFASDGIPLDRKKILLEEPIHSLGVFQVPIKLHPEVTATVKVWVVKE